MSDGAWIIEVRLDGGFTREQVQEIEEFISEHLLENFEDGLLSTVIDFEVFEDDDE